ncbi:Cytidylyltransferase-like, putative [Leishmania lindenbergi]|uniref:Cytidylyltransferase-like n=1 Tax=Leishmania lindenbergi TaxID=651832 RepID=A0AAW3A0Z8_9TRYP
MTPSVLLSTSCEKDVNAKSLVAYLIRSVLTPIATKAAKATDSASAASELARYCCPHTELHCGHGSSVDVYLAIHNRHRSTFLEHSVYLYSAVLEVCPQLSISIIPVIGTAKKEEMHVSGTSSSPALSQQHQQQRQFSGLQRSAGDSIELYDDVAAVLQEWKLLDKSFMRDAEGFQPHYKYVAVGGTFDHFHSGHKVLLSTAALYTIQKLRVGVTDASLLTKKRFAESLQSMEVRMEHVAQFLHQMRPDLELELAPISEVSGGTKSIPEVEALVVSPETANSIGVINEMRAANGGLAPMVGISIPQVRSPTGELISSTALRERQIRKN